MPNITLPVPFMRLMASNMAEKIRDSVNSYFGEDRLRVSSMHTTPGETVVILFDDENAPEDCRLYAEWEQDVDVDMAISMIISGLEEHSE